MTADFCDQYVFIALGSFNKAILAYRIGKQENTDAFVADLRERLISNPQISSDAWHGCEGELLA